MYAEVFAGGGGEEGAQYAQYVMKNKTFITPSTNA